MRAEHERAGGADQRVRVIHVAGEEHVIGHAQVRREVAQLRLSSEPEPTNSRWWSTPALVVAVHEPGVRAQQERWFFWK